MNKKNIRVTCENQPPWYKQLIKLDEQTRLKAFDQAMAKIKIAKPDAYKFISDFKLELVGFIPNVAYTMPDNSERSLGVTFVHDFSQYTLLLWCRQGGFLVTINASLDYNVKGLRGLVY